MLKPKAVRRGRPRSNKPRIPCGQVRQETDAEIRAVVELQPHRRGAEKPSDPALEHVAERLILTGRVSVGGMTTNDLNGIVARYRAIHAAFKVVEGRPPGLAVRDGGSGRDVEPDEAIERKAAWAKLGRELRKSGPMGDRLEWAAATVILHEPTFTAPQEWAPPPHVVHYYGEALRVLVRVWGVG